MELTSSAFENEGQIPSKYTCDGQNINPPLNISGVPSNAESLVLIMDDHDVPKEIREDGVFDHWVVFNIPPDNREIAEGKEPEGMPGKNTAGKTGYYGPCPPDREHRYFFRLYALDIRLELHATADKLTVEKAMTDHVVDRAYIMGRYERV